MLILGHRGIIEVYVSGEATAKTRQGAISICYGEQRHYIFQPYRSLMSTRVTLVDLILLVVVNFLTVEITALFKVPFFNAKSCKKLMKNYNFFLKRV